MRATSKLFMAVAFLTLLTGHAFSAEFPLRDKYPEVKPISIEDLNASYNETIIIDVRSKEEFDVIHISKAEHIPVTKTSFLTDLEKVRSKNDTADIAFYCNGHTCAKSYKAAEKAMGAGFENIYCFDAGIFEWATTYPENSVLLNNSPVEPSSLISKEDLKARMLDWTDFSAKASAGGAMVIDIRDPFQRAKNATLDQNKNVKLKNVRNIPLNRLAKLLDKGEFKDKPLLIFDAVGKQVRWLQYYLEEGGYNNYAFLEKGVLAAAAAGAVN